MDQFTQVETRVTVSQPLKGGLTEQRRMFRPLAKVVVFLIRLYQGARLGRASGCRFYPSCSEYTAEAITRFGVVKGVKAGVTRLWRCRPGGGSGVDLVSQPIQGECDVVVANGDRG